MYYRQTKEVGTKPLSGGRRSVAGLSLLAARFSEPDLNQDLEEA